MTNAAIKLIDNWDLAVGEAHRENWNVAVRRRAYFHRLHEVVRYGFSVRAPKVWQLRHDIDRRIGGLGSVQDLVMRNEFSGMAVVHDDALVYERYAHDYAPGNAHSVMSISKTMTHLIVGRLVDDGLIDTNATVGSYLPEIGSGYFDATVQQVLDMNLRNDYDEDYSDPHTAALKHEAAMGWRLPPAGEVAPSNREFLVEIASSDIVNPSGEPQYKSANTDVLGWIAERVSGVELRQALIDIVEAAGIEHTFFMSTDRDGVPNLNGGVCMSARDLARYGQIFVRGGVGVDGRRVGGRNFIAKTLECRGTRYAQPESHIYYCNQLRTNGRWLGHGGWGGQFLFVDPLSKTSVAFFSVLENDAAADWNYQLSIISMAEQIAALPPRTD